ncbi:MAG: AgmX/PglI C-terminal domain-containing protein [Myxococcales bacterium]|nr:AgmX/PglI C-terminal domain-containing protein [Myxococcales bacterium]
MRSPVRACAVVLWALLGHLGCAPPPPVIPTLPPPPARPVASTPIDEVPPAPKDSKTETAKADRDERLAEALGALDESGVGDGATSHGTLSALSGAPSGGVGLLSGGAGGGIGLGSAGAGGLGTGSGFGRLGSGSGSSITLRQGATQVVGRLPPEVIQRIVRMNFGRMRLCYESALRTNPKLGGRASVRFVIGPTGAVASAVPGPTDFAPPAMQTCLATAFRGMSFPQPDGGGSVTVVYPIHFHSDSPPPPPPPPPAPRPRAPAPPPAPKQP